MKLAIHYLNKVGFAGHSQSMVSLVFFLLFVFILYMIFKGNKKEYKDYGNLPLEDNDSTEKFNSQEKTK